MLTLYDRFAGKYIKYKTVASQPWETGKVLERRHEDPMVLYVESIAGPLDFSDQDERPLRFSYPGAQIEELGGSTTSNITPKQAWMNVDPNNASSQETP